MEALEPKTIKNSIEWYNECPNWCDGEHHEGFCFLGTHDQMEVLHPEDQLKGGRILVRQRLLMAGVTYRVALCGQNGGFVIVIGDDESIEDFEKRIEIATTRFQARSVSGVPEFDDHVDLERYVSGY